MQIKFMRQELRADKILNILRVFIRYNSLVYKKSVRYFIDFHRIYVMMYVCVVVLLYTILYLLFQQSVAQRCPMCQLPNGRGQIQNRL